MINVVFTMKKTTQKIALVLLGSMLAACTTESPDPAESVEPPVAVTTVTSIAELEEAVPENPLKDAYFGETHMHTAMSLDALIGMIGTGNLLPDDAYRLAKGETLTVSGLKHNIGRPLDFAAVTDHAEYIGESYSAIMPGAPGYDTPELQQLRAATTFDEQMTWYGRFSENQRSASGPQHPSYYAGPETTRSAWQQNLEATAAHYEPGKFTTFAAFEWSSVVRGGNLHRNIIFRDMLVPELPFSAIESTDETKLWEWLTVQEGRGSTVLAIPHNSNAGKGLMFADTYPSGKPLDAKYAEQRNRFERVIEIMQIKGSSEVHRKFWPADEFADFENADSMSDYAGRTPMKENFVRWAIARGMQFEKTLGTNPFQLGFVGGTDNHNGAMSDVVEDNFIGAHGPADVTVDMRRNGEVPGWAKAKDINPGAITGVWATKNTRGEIWDAMHRRETFATSGPRIKPRIFCGPNVSAEPADAVSMVRGGYDSGVPMGGVLRASEKAPTCTVYAAKDSDGANLERIQIIKSWIDGNDEPQEKIVNVAWSDGRRIADDGTLAAVGNTVNLEDATYTNTIGSAELTGSWTDTDFDPTQSALYYARVLEIPTPRWSTFDAVRAGLPLLENMPATIQERAWTSPIWYLPDD
jgi:hypothetical protein